MVEVTQADRECLEKLQAVTTDGFAGGYILHDEGLDLLAAHRATAYAAGVSAERERCANWLRSDAMQTQIEARRILGNLIKLTPADTDDWAKLIAMKHAIADMLEQPSAGIRISS